MARIVKYIRQDATDRGQALNDSSTLMIDAPDLLYAVFMPAWKASNKRATTSKAKKHADTSDQVSDLTEYFSGSDGSTKNHNYGNRKADRVNKREDEWSTQVQDKLVPEDVPGLLSSNRRDDPPLSASSDSLRSLNCDSDSDGDSTVEDAFLGLLDAIGRMYRKVLVRQPHKSEMSQMVEEVDVSPGCRTRGGSGGTELTAAEEREAARRARGHWICHVCKSNGVTTVNLEKSDKLCRSITCSHDHSGCKDCPSRGNNMYSELLEHYMDVIRDEKRQRGRCG